MNNTTTTTMLQPILTHRSMANSLSDLLHHLVAAVNSLRAISSRHGRARWSADQEKHQALLEDDELIDLDEFMSDDFERFRVYGIKLEA